MTVNENLDLLDEMLDGAWSVPLSGGKCMVDIDKIREILDDIRLNLPSEIKQAKLIVSDRKIIIEDARKEAESILRVADERAKKLVETNEIIRQAQEMSKDVIAQTNNQNRELKRATNEFIDNALKSTEEVLAAALQEIKGTRQAFKQPNIKR